MPTAPQIYIRKQHLRHAMTGQAQQVWRCPKCSRLIIDMHGGRQRHENACKGPRVSAKNRSDKLRVIRQRRHARQRAQEKSPATPNKPRRQRSALRKPQLTAQTALTTQEEHEPQPEAPHPEPMPQPELSLGAYDWDSRESIPRSLEEGQVWIRHHPASGRPSGFQTPSSNNLPGQIHPLPSPQTHSQPKRPPYHPFATQFDYEQAQILIKHRASSGFITDQLQLIARYFGTGEHRVGSPEKAQELHELLAESAPAEKLAFDTHEITTTIKNITFNHQVRARNLWTALTEVVRSPELRDDLVWLPLQRFIRSRCSAQPTPTLEESWHGRDWWNAQSRVGPDDRILYLQLYADATKLSTCGGAKLWPVYAWLGNVPAELRKRRGKGGAALIAYLPVVEEDKRLNGSDMAELRSHIYQESLRYILEPIEIAMKFGKLVRCGDGIVRRLYVLIGTIAVDYEELMKFLALLGAKSKFPCALCLVPREFLGDLSGAKWPLRTYSGTMDLHNQADSAKFVTHKKAIRQEQSLRETKSHLLQLMGEDYTAYDAIAFVDPLHQIEQGIFGKHMWPKLIATIGQGNCGILDQRFKGIPVYPELKHFPNGVTGLRSVQGYEHATILHMLAPLIEDLVPEAYKVVTLKTIRLLARIHLLEKLTTQTDETLELLDQEIVKFGQAWEDFSSQFDTPEEESDVSAGFPKLHSLTHHTTIIRNKSSSDNYETGIGEGLHPHSKADYKRTTNQQPGYEDQMLRTHREQETIKLIDAEVRRHTENRDRSSRSKRANDEDSPRVELGSRKHRLFTSTFIENLPHPLPRFQQQLQIFLYENVLGRGTRRLPSLRQLPSLNHSYVIPCGLIRVAYISLLDSRDGLDIIRTTPQWRKTGPRHDCVIVQDSDRGGIWFAQLVHILALRFEGIEYRIAYIRRFRSRSRRSALTGYVEVDDKDEYAFIFVDSIVRSCVILSPEVHGDRLVVADLNDSDMFFRLLELP